MQGFAPRPNPIVSRFTPTIPVSAGYIVLTLILSGIGFVVAQWLKDKPPQSPEVGGVVEKEPEGR